MQRPFLNLALLSIGSLLRVTPAHADCAGTPDQQVNITIDAISAPVYDATGHEFKGCLLHAGGQVVGYAKEDKLCNTPLGSNIKLRLSYGCCDTGPNSGDVECVIRSKPQGKEAPAHGNGAIAHSIAP